jgi:type IV pilus assembly protein PilX
MMYMQTHSRQKGVALIVAMILMLIMTMGGLAAMRSSVMQERMTMHTHDRSLSFQATEAALKEAELWIQSTRPSPEEGAPCNGGVCGLAPADTSTPLWEGSVGWKDATELRYGPIAITPQFLVEHLGNSFPCQKENTSLDSTCKRYRITARSNAGSGRASVMLQSLYATE